MDQTFINYIGGAVLAAFGWFARTIYDKQEAQIQALNDFKIQVARDFVTATQLAAVFTDIKEELRYIRERLDTPQRRASDPMGPTR